MAVYLSLLLSTHLFNFHFGKTGLRLGQKRFNKANSVLSGFSSETV